MAAPELRVVRRPKGSTPQRALTAAVAPVTDTQQIFKTAGLGGRSENWQDEAWRLADVVGEFRFYQRWRANSCSRVPLVASEIDPGTGLPTGSISEGNAEGQRVAEIVRKIAGGPLGQAQLIKRSVEILCVPGEYWIAILMRPKGEGARQRVEEKWFAVTREEIGQGTGRDSKGNPTVVITLPDGKKHDFDRGKGDGLFRVWNPHPRRAAEADSPARAVLDPMREIVRTTKKIRNADNSRLVNNGLLMLPSEANLPSVQAPQAAGRTDGPPAPPQQQSVAQTLQQQLVEGAVIAQREGEDSAVSVLPRVGTAPGAFIDKIKHIDIGKDVTKVELEKRNDAIARMAMGLDMSPEQLLGLGSTSNHWNSFLLEDQDVQVHVSPVMQTIVGAIDEAVLANVLEAENIDPSKYTLWFDTSGITADPDKTDEAKDAHAVGAFTSAALVRQFGLPEDGMYDFTSLEGWRQWAQDKVSQDPTLLRDLLPLLDRSLQAVDFPAPTAALPPADGGDEDEDDPEDKPTTEDDADNNGRPAVAASLRGDDVEFAVVDLLVGRALDLAGKRRINTREHRHDARLRSLRAHELHRVMDPVPADEVSRLIAGWDDALDDSVLAGINLSPERIRASVRRIARQKLTSQIVDGQVVS